MAISLQANIWMKEEQKGSWTLEKNEYCKFYFLSHGNYVRQKTKLPKKSRKTQFTENPRKSTVLLKMVHAQGATKLSTMRKQKRVSKYLHVVHKIHFVFLTLLLFLPQKTPRVHKCFAKEIQTSTTRHIISNDRIQKPFNTPKLNIHSKKSITID